MGHPYAHNMDKQEIQELLEKYLAGNCKEEEKQLLDRYFSQYLENSQQLPRHERIIQDTDEIRTALKKYIKKENRNIPMRRLWVPMAAAILLLVTVGIFLYPRHSTLKIDLSGKPVQIGPATNKAILTLANGHNIDLDKAEQGQLVNEEGIKIIKKENGLLTYEIKDKGDSAPIAYHTITTPNGGQYKVVLPDGSCVWLNASSSLKYPTRFIRHRRVELSGEGYFDIAADHHRPFLVISRNQEIKVLGTGFNVNAYENEASINTTLINGRIQVSDRKSGQMVLLHPGQEARLNQSINVSNVDTMTALGWKNNVFYFRGTDIKSVMRQLSRWYDVEIDYTHLPDKTFTGKISRQANLSDVLETMSLTSKLKFKIEERRVMVEP